MSTDYKHLRDVASKATPGEWKPYYEPHGSHGGGDEWHVVTGGRCIACLGDGTAEEAADAAHIAAFHPAQCIALLDENAKLTADLAAARAECERLQARLDDAMLQGRAGDAAGEFLENECKRRTAERDAAIRERDEARLLHRNTREAYEVMSQRWVEADTKAADTAAERNTALARAAELQERIDDVCERCQEGCAHRKEADRG